MGAIEAVDFLKRDHGDKSPEGTLSGFRKEFAEDDPYRSILQRQNKDLNEVLKIFDWDDDGLLWKKEYDKAAKEQDRKKLVRYRRRASFCLGGWRELNEDFRRGDVSCLRDIRTPLVTSRSPLMSAKDEFSDQ